MTDQRVTDTLAYLDEHEAEIAATDGAAFAEREILRRLADAAPSGAGGITGDAYEADLNRGLPAVTDRASARGLAHRIFFATDFGRRQISLTPNYGQLLDDLIVLHIEDTDTLGELLMAAKMLGHESDDTIDGMTAFEAQWQMLDRDGDFAQNYHAILIGGILFALG